MENIGLSRRTFVAGSLATGIAAHAAAAAGATGVPEKTQLRVGLPLNAATLLPVYLAVEQTYKQQGLDVQLFTFRGDAEVAQALAGDSVDVNVASLTGLINLIGAGQPVIGFYSGFYQANFSWLAVSAVKSWADLKGKTIGVSTFGSETDALTRYVLQHHHLTPEKDVQIIQAGGSASAIQAMRAGRLSAAILTAPFKWQAQEEGMTLLGTQANEVSQQWPIHMFMTKTNFLNQYPNTMTAILRAHVSAIRLARANRDLSANVLVDNIKFTKAYAERAYDEIIPSYNERGALPFKSMPAFWTISEETGTVKAPWPPAKFLDDRYIRTFAQWAPR
jgi:NitT/TauT family transport system substrate-binding protein